ncbi:MAG TPA: beta-propeller fold lactonase family protein [Acetobacteraceae bacterium]|jgi:DNA-binding beta-propeller fold protein YncE|nr:beta-propeller fold lactonase family protein [Acetobacteraceae bacterium]
MPSPLMKHCAAASLALLATTAIPALAAPYMIVGNDEKPGGTDAQGKPIVNPTGKDTILIVDVAKPEDPKVVATLPLENSIVGPPTNLAISPNGSIALVADSMTVAEENGVRKQVPTDKVFVIDLKASPPKLVQTVTVGKQPSGLSFSPKGDMALVANRADGTISVLKIDGTQVTQTGTIPISPGVAHVEFTPDGKHALAVKSPDNKLAVLDVDGDKVTYNKLDLPTYAFPYNVVVSPDSKLAITADNGNGGSSDGNADAVSVIDLEGAHPHVISHVTVEDAPEGLAMSPKGDLAVAVNVNGSNMAQAWFHKPTGSVTVLRIQGKTVTPIKTIQVGVLPEAAAFTPDGSYIYVGNFSDQDFSILKVDGTEVTDTGKRFKVEGHPASARMGPR